MNTIRGRFLLCFCLALVVLSPGCAGEPAEPAMTWTEAYEAAALAERVSDVDRALEMYDLAVGLAGSGEDAWKKKLEALEGRARAERAAGRFEDSMATSREALAIHEAHAGEQDPELAATYNRVGMAHQASGDLTRAREYYGKALALREAAFGPDSGELTESLNALGTLDLIENDVDAAEARFQRSLTIMQASLLADHPNLVIGYTNLGQVYQQRGDAGQATEMYRQALRISIANHGGSDPLTAAAQGNLALILRQQKKYKEAEQLYLAAVATLEPLVESRPLELASQLNNLAPAVCEANCRELESPGPATSPRSICSRRIWAGPYPDLASSAVQPRSPSTNGANRDDDAACRYAEALSEMFEQTVGIEHAGARIVARRYIELLDRTGKTDQARALEQRVFPDGEG